MGLLEERSVLPLVIVVAKGQHKLFSKKIVKSSVPSPLPIRGLNQYFVHTKSDDNNIPGSSFSFFCLLG
jgi:hypothetical protein